MVGYRSNGQAPALHRGLPSSHLTLVLSLDGPIIAGDRPERSSAVPLVTIVGGLHREPAYIFRGAHDAGIQLAVHPLAARSLLGLPTAELTELATDATAVVGDGLDRLVHRLGETAAWADRFALVQAYLGRRTDTTTAPAPRAEVGAAWAWLRQRRGRGRMDDLARHVSLSARQLSALFQAEVGCGPKSVARLMRFENARDLVAARARAGRQLRLSEVAQNCGYYDHAHLDREFRSFAGVGPTAWLDEELRNIQAGTHAATAESAT
jgi:AraC-like DNA-binding protein